MNGYAFCGTSWLIVHRRNLRTKANAQPGSASWDARSTLVTYDSQEPSVKNAIAPRNTKCSLTYITPHRDVYDAVPRPEEGVDPVYEAAAKKPRYQRNHCGVAGVEPDGRKEDDESRAQERDDR